MILSPLTKNADVSLVTSINTMKLKDNWRNSLSIDISDELNVGNDDSGVHCKQTDIFSTALSKKPVTYLGNDIVESKLTISKIKNYFSLMRPSLLRRILMAI